MSTSNPRLPVRLILNKKMSNLILFFKNSLRNVAIIGMRFPFLCCCSKFINFNMWQNFDDLLSFEDKIWLQLWKHLRLNEDRQQTNFKKNPKEFIFLYTTKRENNNHCSSQPNLYLQPLIGKARLINFWDNFLNFIFSPCRKRNVFLFMFRLLFDVLL